MEQTKRSAICELRRAGHSPAYICKSLKYPRQTVYDVCRRFDETGQDQKAAHKARSDNILKPCFLAGLKRSVKKNPTVVLSTLAKKRAGCQRHDDPQRREAAGPNVMSKLGGRWRNYNALQLMCPYSTLIAEI